jgi:hypothetical protein
MVDAANVPLTTGDHVTLPVYCAVGVIADTGVPPVAGAVTPNISPMSMGVSPVSLVTGKTAVIRPVLTALVAGIDVPATKKKLACTPARVKPDLAVSVMVAVYPVEAAKGPV